VGQEATQRADYREAADAGIEHTERP